MLIELIFKGRYTLVKKDFLLSLLDQSKEVRFNIPDVSSFNGYDDIVNIFKLNNEIDLVITTDTLNILEKTIPKVFSNVLINNDEIELLLFFDLKDLDDINYKISIDFLKDWSMNFTRKYCFDYTLCRMDNGNNEEYYFDSNGLGPMYNNLIS